MSCLVSRPLFRASNGCYGLTLGHVGTSIHVWRVACHCMFGLWLVGRLVQAPEQAAALSSVTCRAIFTFASHLADDRKVPHFWRTWEEFEGRHGNAMTWREMTRIHRSVAASFSSVHFNTTNVEAAVPVVGDGDPMAALEAAATAAKATQGVTGFVSAGVQGGALTEGGTAAEVVANPEEIDIGDDDDE